MSSIADLSSYLTAHEDQLPLHLRTPATSKNVSPIMQSQIALTKSISPFSDSRGMTDFTTLDTTTTHNAGSSVSSFASSMTNFPSLDNIELAALPASFMSTSDTIESTTSTNIVKRNTTPQKNKPVKDVLADSPPMETYSPLRRFELLQAARYDKSGTSYLNGKYESKYESKYDDKLKRAPSPLSFTTPLRIRGGDSDWSSDLTDSDDESDSNSDDKSERRNNHLQHMAKFYNEGLKLTGIKLGRKRGPIDTPLAPSYQFIQKKEKKRKTRTKKQQKKIKEQSKKNNRSESESSSLSSSSKRNKKRIKNKKNKRKVSSSDSNSSTNEEELMEQEMEKIKAIPLVIPPPKKEKQEEKQESNSTLTCMHCHNRLMEEAQQHHLQQQAQQYTHTQYQQQEQQQQQQQEKQQQQSFYVPPKMTSFAMAKENSYIAPPPGLSTTSPVNIQKKSLSQSMYIPQSYTYAPRGVRPSNLNQTDYVRHDNDDTMNENQPSSFEGMNETNKSHEQEKKKHELSTIVEASFEGDHSHIDDMENKNYDSNNNNTVNESINNIHNQSMHNQSMHANNITSAQKQNINLKTPTASAPSVSRENWKYMTPKVKQPFYPREPNQSTSYKDKDTYSPNSTLRKLARFTVSKANERSKNQNILSYNTNNIHSTRKKPSQAMSNLQTLQALLSTPSLSGGSTRKENRTMSPNLDDVLRKWLPPSHGKKDQNKENYSRQQNKKNNINNIKQQQQQEKEEYVADMSLRDQLAELIMQPDESSIQEESGLTDDWMSLEAMIDQHLDSPGTKADEHFKQICDDADDEDDINKLSLEELLSSARKERQRLDHLDLKIMREERVQEILGNNKETEEGYYPDDGVDAILESRKAIEEAKRVQRQSELLNR